MVNLGTRPTSQVRGILDWAAPGRLYRAETRFFLHTTNNEDMAQNVSGENWDLTPAANESLVVNSVTLLVVDESASDWLHSNFGNTSALSTGITFTLRKGGSEVHDFTSQFKIVSNQTLWKHTAPKFDLLDPGNTSAHFMMSATWDFMGDQAPVLLDATDDVLRMNLNGDASALTSMEARANCFLVVKE